MPPTTFEARSDLVSLYGEADYPNGAKFWILALNIAAVLILSRIDMSIVATAVPSIKLD